MSLLKRARSARRRTTALLLCLAAASLEPAGAVGFRLPNQDPQGIARGNAFVATADNPSAIYYNPAGITQLEGHNIHAGLYFASTGVSYDGPLGRADTDSSLQAVPQLHYVYSPKDSKFSFGLGAYVPYGLGINYGDNNVLSTLAQEAQLLYLSISPVLAYQVHETLSISAGLTFNYSDVYLKRSLAPGGMGEFRFDGDGHAFGFVLGVLWQPCDQWSLGAAFRSPTEVTYEGKSRIQPPSRIPTPPPTSSIRCTLTSGYPTDPTRSGTSRSTWIGPIGTA